MISSLGHNRHCCSEAQPLATTRIVRPQDRRYARAARRSLLLSNDNKIAIATLLSFPSQRLVRLCPPLTAVEAACRTTVWVSLSDT